MQLFHTILTRSDSGLAQLPRLAGVLLTLHLDKCIRVTDVGVIAVAQVCARVLVHVC